MIRNSVSVRLELARHHREAAREQVHELRREQRAEHAERRERREQRVFMSWRPSAHASSAPRFCSYSVNVGMNDADIAPRRTGRRWVRHAERGVERVARAKPAPFIIAITVARRPSTRESSVAAPTLPALRATALPAASDDAADGAGAAPLSGASGAPDGVLTGPPSC